MFRVTIVLLAVLTIDPGGYTDTRGCGAIGFRERSSPNTGMHFVNSSAARRARRRRMQLEERKKEITRELHNGPAEERKKQLEEALLEADRAIRKLDDVIKGEDWLSQNVEDLGKRSTELRDIIPIDLGEFSAEMKKSISSKAPKKASPSVETPGMDEPGLRARISESILSGLPPLDEVVKTIKSGELHSELELANTGLQLHDAGFYRPYVHLLRQKFPQTPCLNEEMEALEDCLRQQFIRDASLIEGELGSLRKALKELGKLADELEQQKSPELTKCGHFDDEVAAINALHFPATPGAAISDALLREIRSTGDADAESRLRVALAIHAYLDGEFSAARSLLPTGPQEPAVRGYARGLFPQITKLAGQGKSGAAGAATKRNETRGQIATDISALLQPIRKSKCNKLAEKVARKQFDLTLTGLLVQDRIQVIDMILQDLAKVPDESQ